MSGAKAQSSNAAGSFASMAIASGAIAILQISFSIALAALIFSGPLSPALPTAAGAFILSGALASMFIGWRSSSVGVFASTQDTAGVVVATVVGPATLALSGETRQVTALIIVAISTLIIGAVFLLLGQLRLGSLVRYLPQPVVGGFVAGTGWLMFRGGVEVMVNRTITPGTLVDALQWNELQFIAPGLLLAVYIVIAVARRFPPLSISLGVVSAAAIFYAVVAATSSVTAVESGGWLVGPFSSSAQWSPITPSDLTAVDWPTVASQAPAFAAIALIAVVGLLLNLTALEAVADEDIDFDQELRVSGAVNILGGGLGGLSAWHRIGDTILAQHLEARNRVVPVVVGALGITLMVGGSRIVELVPRAVAGGVLAGLGLALLWGWLKDYVIPSEKPDRLLGIGILAGIAIFGPLLGVGLGVVVAAALFVFQYSRIDPVRHLLSGRAIKSTVDRAPHVEAALASQAAETEIIILDGYLFFGSATRAAQSISIQAIAERPVPLRSLILDLSRVIGIDVSAATALTSTINRILSDGVSVTVSGAGDSVRQALTHQSLEGSVLWAPTLDDAIEANEERILVDLRLSDAAPFVDVLDEELAGRGKLFLEHCERIEISSGDHLITAGDASDALYFIERGELSVMSPSATGVSRRLRKTGPGAVLGEVAFAAGGTRTADVVAETAVVAHQLTRASLESLRSSDPELAADFHAFLTRLVVAKLRSKVDALDELLR